MLVQHIEPGCVTRASFTSARQLRGAIDAFVETWNEKAVPFEWTKAVVHATGLRVNYSDLDK